MIKPIGTAQLGPFVSLQFKDEETAKAFVKEVKSVIKFDGAPLPDKDGIVSVYDVKIDLTDAESIYADDFGYVVVKGHKLNTFATASTTRSYIQILAGFNPNLQEMTENVYVDTTAVNMFFVDKTPTGYIVGVLFKNDLMLRIKEFDDVYSAFEFKNKLDCKR